MNVLLSPIGDIVDAAGSAEGRGAFAEASALWFAAAARIETLAEKRGMSKEAVEIITARRRAHAEECRAKSERRDALVIESAAQLTSMQRDEELIEAKRRIVLIVCRS